LKGESDFVSDFLLDTPWVPGELVPVELCIQSQGRYCTMVVVRLGKVAVVWQEQVLVTVERVPDSVGGEQVLMMKVERRTPSSSLAVKMPGLRWKVQWQIRGQRCSGRRAVLKVPSSLPVRFLV